MKNNENSKTFNFSFTLNNVSDFDTIKKIRNYKELGYNSQSDLLRDAVMQFLDNDGKSNNIKEEIEKAKLTALNNKNSNHSLISRKLDAETRITEYHADNLDVIGDKPSNQAKEAMTHHIKGTIPYDEDAVHCPDCNWHTNSKDSTNYQINGITWHVQNFHKRNLTEDEATKLSELLI